MYRERLRRFLHPLGGEALRAETACAHHALHYARVAAAIYLAQIFAGEPSSLGVSTDRLARSVGPLEAVSSMTFDGVARATCSSEASSFM